MIMSCCKFCINTHPVNLELSIWQWIDIEIAKLESLTYCQTRHTSIRTTFTLFTHYPTRAAIQSYPIPRRLPENYSLVIHSKPSRALIQSSLKRLDETTRFLWHLIHVHFNNCHEYWWTGSSKVLWYTAKRRTAPHRQQLRDFEIFKIVKVQ